ncbi:DUF4340 domain-containing protein [Arhodomonas sp. AD133]|uniref:DUF4340 domain-containing protein n=1 Tax=Arhodomonas sp. AD133 TaxID=3415009 RepID=UPI003EBE8FCD
MNRAITALSVLLAAQLVLAAGLWFTSADSGEAPSRDLMALTADEVTTVSLADADGEPLKLARTDDTWTLPSNDGFPAATTRVDALVSDLAGLSGRIPVARSEEAFERFRVADDAFERRVKLKTTDGRQATMLIGKSAGAGRVYARNADSDAVYEVAFSARRATPDPQHWYDTDTVGVDPADVKRVSLPSLTLERKENGWALAKPSQEGTELDGGEAARLVTDLANPAFESVSKAEPPEGEPTLSYAVETKAGKSLHFHYYATSEDGTAVLTREDQPWRYQVATSQLTALQDTSVETLLAGKDAEQGDKSQDTAAKNNETAGSGHS